MNIKVLLYTLGTKSYEYDITNMVETIDWEGDIGNKSRSVALSFTNIEDIKDARRLISYKNGDMIMLFKDGTEFFRGYIFKNGVNDQGGESLTAYDSLIYVDKNSHSILVKNKYASDVISSLLRKFGLSYSYIEYTSHKIKKLVFDNKSLSDIFDELITETKKYNGKNYYFTTAKGKISMYSRSNSPKVILTIAEGEGYSASRESSIEDVVTQVMVTKGNLDPGEGDEKFTSYTTTNDSNSKKWGIIQMVENADDDTSYADMKKKAASLLKSEGKEETTYDFEYEGVIECITGTRLDLTNRITGISGKYYVTSDKHSFKEGQHTMSLQLSTKLE